MLALLRYGGSSSRTSGIRPFLANLVQKTVPGATNFNWAKVEALASERRITDLPQLLEHMLYRADQEAFGDSAIRHLVLGELDSDGTFKVFMGSPDRDHFYWSQEELDKASRPHLLVRAGEEPHRHMQILPDQFAALYRHLGPNSPRKWWPSVGKEVDGLVGINWRNKATGQVLVDTPPPVE